MNLLSCVRSIGKALIRPVLGAEHNTLNIQSRGIISHACSSGGIISRSCFSGGIISRACSSMSGSGYDAYPKYQESTTPFKRKIRRRMGYYPRLHLGGVKPRPKGEYEDIPVGGIRTQPTDWTKRNAWTKKKALFGQNDYIDILGDGSVHPYQLMQGPAWLRGFKGNELQRLVRRMKYEGQFLQEVYPTKYHELQKQIWFLYKKLNTRRKAPFWSGNNPYRNSRFLRTKERFR